MCVNDLISCCSQQVGKQAWVRGGVWLGEPQGQRSACQGPGGLELRRGPSTCGRSWLAPFSSGHGDLSPEPLTHTHAHAHAQASTQHVHTRVHAHFHSPSSECPPGPCCCPPGGPQPWARPLVTSWRKIVAGAWWPGPGGGLGSLPGHHLTGHGAAKLLPHQKCALPAGAKPGLSAAGRALRLFLPRTPHALGRGQS